MGFRGNLDILYSRGTLFSNTMKRRSYNEPRQNVSLLVPGPSLEKLEFVSCHVHRGRTPPAIYYK